MKMELLAPCGNFEKFETAIKFGADAVYLSGKNFGLRAFAGNFSNEEIKIAVEKAHSLDKKVYVTLNIVAKDEDFNNGLFEYLTFLQSICVDGVIASDTGVIYYIRQNFPKIDVHVSTQANVNNSMSAKFFADMGVKRIVLARELSLEQIKNIRKNIDNNVELEAFVHGAMCISYSGRCLLSNYMTGRDSNHGECAQSCRWKYTIKEAKRDEEMEIQEDERGTYILNSKDLCLIQHLQELFDAGVCSFKVEGRMKSVYYVATVINAYRQAIDMLPKMPSQELIDELKKASHRGYTKGFMFHDENKEDIYSSMPKQTHEFVAMVLQAEDKTVLIEQRNYFKEGDVLEILSPNKKIFNKKITIKNIVNLEDEKQPICNIAKQLVKIDADGFLFSSGDILRKEIK